MATINNGRNEVSHIFVSSCSGRFCFALRTPTRTGRCENQTTRLIPRSKVARWLDRFSRRLYCFNPVRKTRRGPIGAGWDTADSHEVSVLNAAPSARSSVRLMVAGIDVDCTASRLVGAKYD